MATETNLVTVTLNTKIVLIYSLNTICNVYTVQVICSNLGRRRRSVADQGDRVGREPRAPGLRPDGGAGGLRRRLRLPRPHPGRIRDGLLSFSHHK